MRRRNKQLLGALGLAAVAALTALACTLPTPGASAAPGDQQSADVTVMVTVENNGSTGGGGTGGGSTGGGTTSQLPTVTTVALPDDGEVVNDTAVQVKVGNAKHVQVIRAALDDKGQRVPGSDVTVADYDITSATETITTDLKFNDLPFGDYVFDFIATTANGATAKDSIIIRFRAMKVEVVTTETDAQGDPLVEVKMNERVYSLWAQVYDLKGNPIFVSKVAANSGRSVAATLATTLQQPAAGMVEEPIYVTRDKFNLEKMTYSFYLPMAKYNAPAGDYDLVTVAYDEAGKVIAMNTNRFTYRKAPNIPDTGSLLGDTNIANVDYLLTGLVMFSAVAGFAMYLLFRKKDRR